MSVNNLDTICTECSRVFANVSSMKRHINNGNMQKEKG